MAITVVDKLDEPFAHILVKSTQFKSIQQIVSVDATEQDEEKEAQDLVERIAEAVKEAEKREQELLDAKNKLKAYKVGVRV